MLRFCMHECKCKYNPQIRCFHESCDYIDFKGNVRVCKHFRGKSKFAPRKVVSVLRCSK